MNERQAVYAVANLAAPFVFTIEGRIVPYVRMTRRGKYTDPRAGEYLESQRAIRWQFKQQMSERGLAMLPPQTPLAVSIIVETKRGHTFDTDNAAKAVLDAAQGIVFGNDLWIDWLHVERRKHDREWCSIWFDTLKG